MAIYKLPSGRYQARLEVGGRVVSSTFCSRMEAQKQVLQWRQEKKAEGASLNKGALTVGEFFSIWIGGLEARTPKQGDSGWRKHQRTLYRLYVQSIIGDAPLASIAACDIDRVLCYVAAQKRSFQTQRHVYVLLRHMFSDAQKNHHLIVHNPALPKMKPKVPIKEAPHLNLEEAQKLLSVVEGRKYELAVWVQFYLGLRVGELIALRWDHLDLDEGLARIAHVYVRKTRTIRTYPKGGKCSTRQIPAPLLDKLREANKDTPYVCHAPTQQMLSYEWYVRTLRQYCKEAGIRIIGTHGLRHTTAELYCTMALPGMICGNCFRILPSPQPNAMCTLEERILKK